MYKLGCKDWSLTEFRFNYKNKVLIFNKYIITIGKKRDQLLVSKAVIKSAILQSKMQRISGYSANYFICTS